MKKVTDFFRKGNIIPITLIASAFVGFITVMSLIALPNFEYASTSMYLNPLNRNVSLDATFTVDVVVESSIPVNVFAGELMFDTEKLQVQSIDYNTSIADLWAEKPWYSNGEGTLNFIGGTTAKGGFEGRGTLITVTFKAKKSGEGSLIIKNPQILQHDGLGTDVPLSKPLDAIFTISPTQQSETTTNLLNVASTPTTYHVVQKVPTTDLNGDGKQTITDVSILLLNMGSTDVRFDLNLDGIVDLQDLNVLLQIK